MRKAVQEDGGKGYVRKEDGEWEETGRDVIPHKGGNVPVAFVLSSLQIRTIDVDAQYDRLNIVHTRIHGRLK
jgi:hypothetical protein